MKQSLLALPVALLMVASLMGLSACGNKGPLYLPEPTAQPQSSAPGPSQPTIAPASAEHPDAADSGT